MINGNQLVNLLTGEGLNFITGIPCSILKDFLFCLSEKERGIEHIIVASEEEAISIGTGYYLATAKIPIVYMQNSGLARSVDVLTSLVNKEVYRIPMLLLISWRGEPGKKDEPQHLKMGKITLKLLKTLSIPYAILSDNKSKVAKEVKEAKKYLKNNSLPYAIIIRKGLIKPCQAQKGTEINSLSREEAIKIIVDNSKGDEIIISTTGKISRELFEYREAKEQSHKTDFYTLGSMGCSAAIALGIALKKPKKKVLVFDGDGSVLMQMGALATIGHYLPKNFYHIIFDNNAHDSTGGQKTASNTASFNKIALACGYKGAETVLTQRRLTNAVRNLKRNSGPRMLVVKIKKGSRKDLGRPATTPIENKKLLMNFLLK